MKALCAEIGAFRRRKGEAVERAAQTVALQLAAGVDLAGALSASAEGRARLVVRLERLIERERLRGMRRHWSYDLNRHIALKQALDRLRAPES